MTPDLPSSVPWWQRYRMPWRRASLTGVALVALAAGLTTSIGHPGQSLTAVRSVSHEIYVEVPTAWAREFHTDLEARPAATSAGATSGLLVATDADSWHTTDVPSYGVYTTVVPGSRDLDRVADTDPCEGDPQERFISVADWEGTVWDWPECNGAGAFTSAAVHEPGVPATVYLEIRQPELRPDLVDEIVTGIRVG